MKDKIVFVSGANRGIGKALVEALLEQGVSKVYASARNLDQMPDFQDGRVVPVKLDITKPEQILAAAQTAADINILINNSGVASFTSMLDDSIDLVQRDMNTNFFGTLNMMRAFIPVLEKNVNPAIVNVVSIVAFVNFPILGGYCASKAALFSATQGARIELAAKGIKVHTVNPGPIDTDMAKDFEADKTSPEETAQNILAELNRGVSDIFPDPGGQAMFEVWKNNYQELEQMVAEM